MTGIRIKFLMTLTICLTFSVLVIGIQWEHSEQNRKQLNQFIQKLKNNSSKDIATEPKKLNIDFSVKTRWFQTFDSAENKNLEYSDDLKLKLQSVTKSKTPIFEHTIENKDYIVVHNYDQVEKHTFHFIQNTFTSNAPNADLTQYEQTLTDHSEVNNRWLLVISLIMSAFISCSIVFIENINKKIRKVITQIAAFSEGNFKHLEKLDGNDEFTAVHVLTNNLGKNLQGYIDSIIENNRSTQSQKMIDQYIESKRLNERRFLNGYVLNPRISQDDLLVWGMKWVDENNYIIWSITPSSMSGSICENIIELSQFIEDNMDERFGGKNRFVSSTINEVISSTFDRYEEIIQSSLCSLTFIHIDFARECFEVINHLTPIFIEDDDQEFTLVQTNNTKHSLAASDISKSKIPLDQINRFIFSSYSLMNSKNPVLCNLSTYRHLKKTTGLDEQKNENTISMIEIKRQIDDIETEMDGVA